MELMIVIPDEEAMRISTAYLCDLKNRAIQVGDLDLLETVADVIPDLALANGLSQETETMLGFARLDARNALQAFYNGTDLFVVIQ